MSRVKMAEIAKKHGIHPITNKEVADHYHSNCPYIKLIGVWNSTDGRYDYFRY